MQILHLCLSCQGTMRVRESLHHKSRVWFNPRLSPTLIHCSFHGFENIRKFCKRKGGPSNNISEIKNGKSIIITKNTTTIVFGCWTITVALNPIEGRRVRENFYDFLGALGGLMLTFKTMMILKSSIEG